MPKVNLTPYSGKPTKEEKIAAKMAYYMRLGKISAKDMAVATGLSERGFRNKLNATPATFRLDELVLAAKRLDVKLEELVAG